MSLPICATYGANHQSSECYLAAAEASSPEQAAYAQNFQLQQNNPYSQTYNFRWRNLQNFSYDNTRNIQNSSNQQMIKMLTESPQGIFPSDTKATSMEDMSSITTMSEEQLPEILENRPVVQIEKSPTKEEEHVENEKLIINKQNENATFHDVAPI
ncbi:Uncharacterized protein Adt_05129 [Abeliophyllum distichum]|uniref:Uncharacterized protein n=1 Tax=Abeliophyllum distichum TaxID=126358 RepID=A0ABD1V389_9LAMI